MTTFDDREQNFEKEFKHDQELRFKTNARRNKLFGLWAAGRMGLAGPAADTYARAVVEADLDRPGGVGARDKVMKDLAAKGLAVSEGEVERERERLLVVAREQLHGAGH